MTTSPGSLDLAESVDVVRAVAPDHWQQPADHSGGPDRGLLAGRRSGHEPAVGPSAAVRQTLTAIEESDGTWQAWAYVDADQATSWAAQAENRLRAGGRRRPLEGMTVGVKDVIDVAGMPCTAGFVPFAERVPGRDAAVVARLREQGALVVGKTVTTQFAFSDPAPTLNPFDPARTPGGSSSGSAVAVAVGHVPVTLGTQTSGSTIRPAAYNGVVGFKPSRGRVPTEGVLPLAWSLDEVGILGRTVEHCAEVFRAVAGPASPERHGNRRALRVGMVEDAFEIAAPEVAAAVAGLGAVVNALGFSLASIRVGHLQEIAAAHRVIMTSEMGAVHGALYARHPEHYGSRVAQVVREGLELAGHDYVQARRLQDHLAAVIAESFVDVDVWLLPSVTGVAPSRETTGDRSLQIPASLLGLPAVSVPVGLSAAGLPIGAQFVGAVGADEDVLGLAAAVCRSALYGERAPVPPGRAR
jgi:Asp-tRNA(Asn)/Glu-tRNA(Gln) amidotransferase A subunit family amidase